MINTTFSFNKEIERILGRLDKFLNYMPQVKLLELKPYDYDLLQRMRTSDTYGDTLWYKGVRLQCVKKS